MSNNVQWSLADTNDFTPKTQVKLRQLQNNHQSTTQQTNKNPNSWVLYLSRTSTGTVNPRTIINLHNIAWVIETRIREYMSYDLPRTEAWVIQARAQPTPEHWSRFPPVSIHPIICHGYRQHSGREVDLHCKLPKCTEPNKKKFQSFCIETTYKRSAFWKEEVCLSLPSSCCLTFCTLGTATNIP